MKRVLLASKKLDVYQSFWSVLSIEKKLFFFKLRVGDLREYFRSFRDSSAAKTLLEAVGFAEKKTLEVLVPLLLW